MTTPRDRHSPPTPLHEWERAYAGEPPVDDLVRHLIDNPNPDWTGEQHRDAVIAALNAERARRDASGEAAPGNPGPPVPEEPKPGYKSSEFGVIAASIVVIAAIVVGAIWFSSDIESLSPEIRMSVLGLVGAVATWALKNLGIEYLGKRTTLKLDSKR